MKNIITVSKGSSVNADNISITITNGENKIFEENYYYGYNVSWNKAFAKKDAPLDIELIKDKAKEYGVEMEDIQYEEGRNIFKESIGG